ncbi:MAG: NAD-dependent epimerase/dehydratase family protein, partial [bacterium]|nr:NAD-dependent epimerase/dehydratase family protein [bacterium]
MRILVTGGTGLIGSNIAKELLRLGHDILLTGHDAEQKIPGFKGKYLQPSFIGLDWDAIGHVDAVF